MLHPFVPIALTVARLVLAVLGAHELDTAMTTPPGRLRRRHAVLATVGLIGSVIRL